MKFPKLKKKSEKYRKFSLLVQNIKITVNDVEDNLGSKSISLPILPLTTQE